jgi:hypothetical protein
MKYDPISRRFFLQGMGGSLMALPLLPSLMPSTAAAQAVQNQKFFVVITVDHGGTGFNRDWYPAAFIENLNSNLFTQSTLIPSGGQNNIPHVIRRARLANLLNTHPGHDGGNVDNGQERLSFILGSFLNPYINKLNMFAGLDGGMTYYGHSRAVSAGSLYGVDQSVVWPTVDHFLANSPRFYLNRDAISVSVVNRGWYSWVGNGVGFPSTSESVSGVYNALFSRYQDTQNTAELAARAKRSFLIDRVIEDYQRVVNGNNNISRRISSADRMRLSQHSELMFEVEQKYRNLINSCSEVTRPNIPSQNGFWAPHYSSVEAYTRTWDILTDLLALGFSCGATQIANLAGDISHFLHAGDYHQDIAHQHTNSRSAQLIHNRNIRWQAEHIFAAMVRKLDGIDVGNGQTLLDRGLINFMHECGTTTHDHFNLGCVTAGSLDGYFNTGNFVDYRNLQNLGLLWDWITDVNTRPGIPLQSFYSNVLQGYGIPPQEFRRNNRPGYGSDATAPSYNGTRNNPNRHLPYPVELVNRFDEPLPVVRG